MKALKILTALLCLTLCLWGCSKAPQTQTPDDSAPVSDPTDPSAPSDPADDGMVTYVITVVDENGDPIPGAMVQLCKDACIPGVANEQGVVNITVPEDDYKVSMLSMPDGYTYSTEAQEFYFESGSLEMTIVLKAA